MTRRARLWTRLRWAFFRARATRRAKAAILARASAPRDASRVTFPTIPHGEFSDNCFATLTPIALRQMDPRGDA